MCDFGELSDQLNNWSDNNDETSDKFTSPSSGVYSPATGCETRFFTGIFDRTLQKVWQTWMQMCERAWTWSQVLSISKHPRSPSRNDLCAAGLCEASRNISGKFFGYSCASRGNLRNQPRSFAAARGVLENRIELYISKSPRLHRSWSRGNSRCQHDSKFSLCRSASGGNK